MVDVVLLIVLCIAPFLMAALNALLIIQYQNRSEAAYAIPSKVVVALALIVGECCVLMLPFDVANTTADGGIPTGTLWMVLYCLVAIFSIVVLPFVFVWHQNDITDLTGNSVSGVIKRVLTTIATVIIVLLVFVIVCTVVYLFFGVAEIPVTRLDAGTVPEITDPAHTGCTEPCGTRSGYVSFRVSPVLFLVTVIDFVGYLVMIIFGSVGLASVPYDLIWGFKTRPHALSERTYNEQKTLIYQDAVKLLDWGKELRDERRNSSHKSTKQRQKYNKWRAGVDIVERRYKQLEELHRDPGALVLMGYLKLFFGIIAAVFSLAWIVHIVLYLVIPNRHLLCLNGMFLAMNNAWSFLGTIAYGLFAFYLLFCVIAGLLKFGLRFFCLSFPHHPHLSTHICFAHHHLSSAASCSRCPHLSDGKGRHTCHILCLQRHPYPCWRHHCDPLLYRRLLGICGQHCCCPFVLFIFDFPTLTNCFTHMSLLLTEVFVESIGSLRILRYFFQYSVFGMVLLPFVALLILFLCRCHKTKELPDYYYDKGA